MKDIKKYPYVLLLFTLLLSVTNVQAEEADDPLASLRALPYANWTTDRVDHNFFGVTLNKKGLAYDGFSLFANKRSHVLLLNMEGEVVHKWRCPLEKPTGEECNYARLLKDGHILLLCPRQEVIKLDWDSNIIWRYAGKVHHEIEIIDQGNILIPIHFPTVKYKSRVVVFESIQAINASGKSLGIIWNGYDRLKELQKLHLPSLLDSAPKDDSTQPEEEYDYQHLNSVQALPSTPLGKKDRRFQAGNLLICLKHNDLIFIIDKDSKDTVWSWGPGVLDFPHTPRMLDNGNILVFDNGTNRGFSRLLEINPLTKKIVWEYKGDPPTSFFSEHEGSAQRLPNGNTLITDSFSGRVFEVTKDKEKVWEYWHNDIQAFYRRVIYRVERYSPEFVQPLFKKKLSATVK